MIKNKFKLPNGRTLSKKSMDFLSKIIIKYKVNPQEAHQLINTFHDDLLFNNKVIYEFYRNKYLDAIENT